jgi:hypothetical protein
MPTVKIQPGKVTVCCGDHDCVEIDTSSAPQSPGDTDATPPFQPPISGGTARYTRMSIADLQLGTEPSGESFWAKVKEIKKNRGPVTRAVDHEYVFGLTVPRGSRLNLQALQRLSEQLDANVHVTFKTRD